MFREGPYARSKPDLLVHVPGEMRRNLACVEVKPFTRPRDEFRDDLRKLTWFCRHARYHRGIFLVYGGGDDDGAGHLSETIREASAGDEEINLSLIHVMRHPVPEARAAPVDT
jgi:hypothetical protein